MGSRARMCAVAVLGVVCLYAFVWPAVAPVALLHTDFLQARQAPSVAHLMGTDSLGADVSVATALGLRMSLLVATLTVAAAAVIGVLVGSVAAVCGGRIDRVCMRCTDTVAGLPALLVTVVISAMFPGSTTAIVAALTATHWPHTARVVRAAATRVLACDYVAVATVAGASRAQIVAHYVLSAVLAQATVAAVMLVPHVVAAESTLSFLGVGINPQTPSLGTMIAVGGPGLLAGQWWPVVFPAGMLVLVTAVVWLAAAPASRTVTTNDGDMPSVQGGALPEGVAAAIDQLTITTGQTTLLNNITMTVPAATITAIIGQSGAGKTSLAHALAGHTPPGSTCRGTIYRRGAAAVIPQHPAESFTPIRRIGPHIADVITTHHTAHTVKDLLHTVGLDPTFATRFPHQLSGGQLRRAALAVALAADPALLIADEPTTGLDPQAADTIWQLLAAITAGGVAVCVVTHDIPHVLNDTAVSHVALLHQGRITAAGTPAHIQDTPPGSHTRALLATPPQPGAAPRPAGQPVAHVRDVTVNLPGRTRLHLPDITAHAGTITVLTGPSGAGKTSAAKTLSGLLAPASGDAHICPPGKVAYMPQHPVAAFDPHSSLGAAIGRAADYAGNPAVNIAALAADVGLDPALLTRRVTDVSGGQAQRAALAQALAQNPALLIADEPTAHLDPATAATITGLLRRYAAAGMAVVVCTHDARVAAAVGDIHVTVGQANHSP